MADIFVGPNLNADTKYKLDEQYLFMEVANHIIKCLRLKNKEKNGKFRLIVIPPCAVNPIPGDIQDQIRSELLERGWSDVIFQFDGCISLIS